MSFDNAISARRPAKNRPYRDKQTRRRPYWKLGPRNDMTCRAGSRRPCPHCLSNRIFSNLKLAEKAADLMEEYYVNQSSH